MATLYLRNGSVVGVNETREEVIGAKIGPNGQTFDFTVGAKQVLSVYPTAVVAVLDNYPTTKG